MPLTDTRLRALKPKDKPYKVTDERGLYVEVTPTGGKLWRFRYRIGGAQKKLCIGSYPEISLKQARDVAYEARRAVASTPQARAVTSGHQSLIPVEKDLREGAVADPPEKDFGEFEPDM
ncbi:MAG: Arm DNA-binding domain-containing protein [Pseudomonadota bacterium]